MTNQNSAAQAADKDFAHELWAAAQSPFGEPVDAAVARVAALLAELRAEGVQASDEEAPPIAPGDEAISECWITASDIDGIAYDGPSFERGYRAALASAPVAGEAQPVAWAAVLSGGKRAGRVYASCDTREEIEAYIQDVHQSNDSLTLYARPLSFADAAPQASEAVRNEALHLLREARALLPAFTTAEAIGAWSEKVRKFEAGEVIDVALQADKAEPVCSCPHQGDGSLRWPCAVHPPTAHGTHPTKGGSENE